MNIRQLERINKILASIYDELDTHPKGIATIYNSVTDLERLVNKQLKNEVWKKYLEAEG